MSPRSVTLAWRWSVGIKLHLRHSCFSGAFTVSATLGVGRCGGRPGRAKGTEGKFPASKVPTLLFRKGWRKETSVYRGSTLPDDVLGALPAFIIPPPRQLYEARAKHLHLPEDKTGAQGLDRAGPRHLALGGRHQNLKPGRRTATMPTPSVDQPPRSLPRGPGSQEPEALPGPSPGPAGASPGAPSP